MAIILAVGSVSGAHLNPVVSCADAVFHGLRLHELAAYIAAQLAGAALGVIIANLMFALPSTARCGTPSDNALSANSWPSPRADALSPGPQPAGPLTPRPLAATVGTLVPNAHDQCPWR